MSQLYLPSPSCSDRNSSDEQQVVKRMRVQSDSSTSDNIPVSPCSNFAREGFTYDKYKAGGPPLQLLPLNDIPLAQSDSAYSISRQLLP
jgi:hypothetical protein